MTQNLIPRPVDREQFSKLQTIFPITALLGPRQSGKTTFARELGADHYFDLENPRDLSRLENAQLTLEKLTGLIVIDEIQRKPELFQLLRFLVDTLPSQRYTILGSASRDLIRQSSETLAGRIGYYYLAGFRISDITDVSRLWLRGGFPRAYIADTDEQAFIWLNQYITTYLERDIPQLGILLPAASLRRFWTMTSHYHGHILNYSELARSFGISDMTTRRYLEILEGTFMVRLLRPWYVNVGKRLVKAPKLYYIDSGIFHCFQHITSQAVLDTHPKLGASFEGFALETVCRSIGLASDAFYFYRTHNGAELDLFWQHDGKNWGVECKFTDAPSITRSMTVVCEDLNLEHLWIVYPGKEEWELNGSISVKPICSIGGTWKYGK
ncbi:MAG: ATP-binding protein [Chitinispirillaceae bacterium]|nr:ATP-binding protein [Chitinispirillaceae bacterium]